LDIPPRTKTTIVKKLLNYTGFTLFDSKTDKPALEKKLNEVVKVSLEPRYVFDECIAYFGQNRIALAGYTTLQDIITSVLAGERKRISSVIEDQLNIATKKKLLELLDSRNAFTDLAKLKKMAKDFTSSQITQELKTHAVIQSLYPDIKAIVSALALSAKNLEYYSTLVKHKSVYKLRRHDDSQTLLYLICYLFFRYRETNDNLVAAFIYCVRKLNDSSKSYAKHRVIDDFNIVKIQLKSAGNLLKYFIDNDMDDELTFGEVRKQAFKLIPAKNIKLLSEHLEKNDFDGRQYEWQYIDTQTNKIRKLVRQ
jgi:hypothetical protein